MGRRPRDPRKAIWISGEDSKIPEEGNEYTSREKVNAPKEGWDTVGCVETWSPWGDGKNNLVGDKCTVGRRLVLARIYP